MNEKGYLPSPDFEIGGRKIAQKKASRAIGLGAKARTRAALQHDFRGRDGHAVLIDDDAGAFSEIRSPKFCRGDPAQNGQQRGELWSGAHAASWHRAGSLCSLSVSALPSSHAF